MHLRPATRDDFETIYAHRRDGLGDVAALAFGPWDAAKVRAATLAECAVAEMILDDTGAVVGHLIVKREADHVWLEELVIAPAAQGRGLGTTALRAVIARAGDLPLRLGVLAPNVRALALYERLGFRRYELAPPRVRLEYARAPRPRCSVFIAASIDGYIARADGGLDWLSLVEAHGEDYGFAAFYATVDALVMGRATYETALGFATWPYADKRVIVLSSQTLAPRSGVEVLRGEPADILAHIGGGAHVYVDGGATIARFLAAGAIDAMTISTIPIVLGSGRPLFAPAPELRPAVATVRRFPSGLVQTHYRL